MDIPGLCNICGKPGRLFSCILCGKLVCKNCINNEYKICSSCQNNS